MKYFVLGALASGFLLYGMSMMYGATGSLEIGPSSRPSAPASINRPVLVFGLVFVVAGLAFKFGAVPFHMWVPDVYQGAPTAVTLLIAGAPKLAAFAITIRCSSRHAVGLAVDWQQMLIVLAVRRWRSATWPPSRRPTSSACWPTRPSAQMGFMLLGLVPGVVSGNTAVGGQWLQLGDVLRAHLRAHHAGHLRPDHAPVAPRASRPSRSTTWRAWRAQPLAGGGDGDLHVLAGRHPADGGLLRQAGRAAGAGLHRHALYIWLAVIAVLLSLVGAFYYLRIVKVMYFDEPADTPAHRAGTGEVRTLLSLNGAAVLVFGILPGGLMAMCAQAILRAHIQIWFARGLQAGERRLDAGEFLDVFAATSEELAGWVLDGRVTDAKTSIGLLWLQQWRAGAWPLTWRSARDFEVEAQQGDSAADGSGLSSDA
jgi:NADH-quinone oxidoreductase subunit N